MEGRHEEDGLGVLCKVEDIGDDKFPYRYFTCPKRAGASKDYEGIAKTVKVKNIGDKKFFSGLHTFLMHD